MIDAIGKPIDRVDGPAKVTGAARYAADHAAAQIAYGVPVGSAIARGRIVKIDTSKAEKSAGVLTVLTRANTPKVNRTTNDFGSWTKLGEARVLFEDDVIHYAGQYVALVVARTVEQAVEAAARTEVTYSEEKPLIETDDAMGTVFAPLKGFGSLLKIERGDAGKAFADAKFKVDGRYSTPIEHHNPMETSAAFAVWSGDELTLYDSTQWVMGARNCVADMLAMPREKVHIISHYVGGGFGCKGFVWPHEAIAAIAARKVGFPVKIMLSRQQMFSACGHRPETQQRVALAADGQGKLMAIRHESLMQTSTVDVHVEQCGVATPWLYSCPNLDISHKLVRVNIATPTPMRAPGESPGLFALESAMDELAYGIGIDPVELRLRNYAETDAEKGLPFSSKHLRECYALGMERFWWKQREAKPRSMRQGRQLIGYGMATATYPGYRFAGAAKVRLMADGTVMVSSATQDIGTGTYTTMRQVAAELLGVDVARVSSELGDSRLPPAPVSGGSMTSASIVPAIKAAVDDVLAKLILFAIEDPAGPFYNLDPKQVLAGGGRVSTQTGGTSQTYAEVLGSRKVAQIEGEANVQPGAEQTKFSFHSFGAQFVEVRVDADLGIVRVPRVVAVFDVGRVLNAKTARSQAIGGITQGIGMALFEHTVYDKRNGRVINDNLADYLVPVNADIGSIEPLFIDKPDPHIGPIGARGIGEIGITGVAAAVANAVFHATGIRVRDLPITIEKLLGD